MRNSHRHTQVAFQSLQDMPGTYSGDKMPDNTSSGSELDRLRRERSFYRHLLELGDHEDVDRFLDQALSLILEATGAQRGYLEVRERDAAEDEPRFWMAHGCYDDDVDDIRAAFSTGIVAQALATGETINVAAARLDPRFLGLASVQRNQIGAALCAPIGRDAPFGVVYLQDRAAAGPFTEEDRRQVEVFAQWLAPLADRLLLLERRRQKSDPTLPLRKGLQTEGLIGRSPAIARMLESVAAAAPLDVGVLLTGPSGTGKTLVARILHESGPRRAGSFVEVNCGALPEQLIENELFGAVAGAHSTATKRVEGKVAAAHGGTFFLDEVGELPLSAQAKLLQLLQSKEYFPLGSAKPQRADVRVIAATNTDLKAAVARKAFREDLYYRLKILTVRVPSLAERREDIAELAQYYCSLFCNKHALPTMRLSSSAIRAIECAEWPGNVRELANAIEAAVARAAHCVATQVERCHVFEDPPSKITNDLDDESGSLQEATRHFQARLLRKTLEGASWNISVTATKLDITRQHVYNLMRAFGIDRT